MNELKTRTSTPARRVYQIAAHRARPFVFINMAMTADGKIASANRAVSSFGSAADHKHLLMLRARADAILCGARTVDMNPVNLGPGAAKFRRLRKQAGLAEYNLRVVVSGSASIRPDAEIFKHRFSPILLLTTESAPQSRLRKLEKLFDEIKICGRDHIDFVEALAWLRTDWGVRKLLCEGGGELNQALFRAGLVDELNLTICPLIFGGREAPTISDGPSVTSLANAALLKLKSKRRVGDEQFLVFTRAGK